MVEIIPRARVRDGSRDPGSLAIRHWPVMHYKGKWVPGPQIGVTYRIHRIPGGSRGGVLMHYKGDGVLGPLAPNAI